MAVTTALLPHATTARRPIAPSGSNSSNLRAARSPIAFVARAAGSKPAPPRYSHRLQQLHQRTLLCRAEGGEDQPPQQPGEQGEAAAGGGGNPPTAAPEAPKRQPVEDPSVAKGQRTAIVTGAISIIFGVRRLLTGCCACKRCMPEAWPGKVGCGQPSL